MINYFGVVANSMRLDNFHVKRTFSELATVHLQLSYLLMKLYNSPYMTRIVFQFSHIAPPQCLQILINLRLSMYVAIRFIEKILVLLNESQ